jgi:hypothetical protein
MEVSLGGDTTALLEDLVDALVGQAGALGQTVGRDAEWCQEFLAEEFARVDVEGFIFHEGQW